MKLRKLLGIFLFAISHVAWADCNTVMGGCVKENTVDTSPHMRSNLGKPKERTIANHSIPVKQETHLVVEQSKPSPMHKKSTLKQL